MADFGGIRVFALGASREYGERVSRHLELALSPIEERPFEDGEHKTRPLVTVRNHDVYVVQSLYADGLESVNDKLCKLLFFIGALKDASANRVTAVVPYLGYARKDQKTQLRDPVTTKYVAAMFEAIGTDKLMTMDVHNLAAMQNAFRRPTEHLTALDLLAETLSPMLRGQDVAVVSPDIGGAKRAARLRAILSKASGREPTVAFVEKQRGGGVVTGGLLVGDVKNRTVVIVDDLIGSGTTVHLAVQACKQNGARRVVVAATHGLFIGKAAAVVEDPAIEKVLVTDTVPPFRLPASLVDSKLIVLDSARLFADAIYRNHADD
jgi:ribose-phosphate pyrophosphokinase